MSHPSPEFSVAPVFRIVQTNASDVLPGEAYTIPQGLEAVSLGRSLDAEICIPDPSVSRAHARIARRGRVWFVTDLASRTGTTLNGAPLAPGVSSPIYPGDMLSVGSTTLRVEGSAELPSMGDPTTVATLADDESSVMRAPTSSSSMVARLLDLLIAQSRRLQTCADEGSIHRVLVEAAQLATGSRRAMVLHTDTAIERVESLASLPADAHASRPSRTLLRRAIEDNSPVMLTQRECDMAASLAENRAAAALCTPVEIGVANATLLYLESDERDSPLREEAAEVCVALASLAAGAMERVRQRDLAVRRERLERDLVAAREVQTLIFPKREGAVGVIRYAFSVNPGAFLAGDLFDAFTLDDGRAAVFLGDVTGEGVDAAVLMSSAAAALHAALLETGDASRAIERANAYLSDRSPMDRFVSLWLGVFDADGSAMTYVDAGHGHWFIRGARGDRRPGATGIPLGIDEGARYRAERIELAPGARVVVYSDGMTEQRSPSGEQYGAERLAESIRSSREVGDDIRLACEALRVFAGTAQWDDDASIASIIAQPKA